ncbi:MAG TPA: ABC transporter permease [Actinomycetota bacterium]|nr:ABC transporter permease [Actinomycetota bacterium]
MSTAVADPAIRDWRQLLVDRPAVALTGVLVLLYVITGLFDPGMFTPNGVRAIVLLACPLAILAASQTLCMLTGGIDLSTVMTANFAAYVAANQSGQGPLVALGLALCVGLAVGLVNGVGVGVFKVNPLIMTLGMASVLLGVVTVGLVGDGFLSGSTRLLPVLRTVASGTLFGPVPTNVLVWALVAGALIFGLSRTGLGRAIYAVGDNPIACRLAGVRIWQVLLAVYVLSALLAALGGLLFSGISGSVGPDQTNAYLLPSVAAAVIGGTSILGGVGGYTGTILGALILTVLNRLLLTLDTTEAFRQILYGLIVLALAWVYVRLTGQRGA